MRRQLVLIFAVPFAAALVAACGTITGLSDDFTFDGGEGGASAGDAGGDGSADAGADTGGGRDGSADAKADAGKCNASQAGQALLAMQGTGTEPCRTCLAQSCCTDVTSCHNDCGSRLQCDLDCTTKGGGRTNCMDSCANDKPSTTFESGLLGCATASCGDVCGFQ